jgi:XTP/dITP diphosphohydrolase
MAPFMRIVLATKNPQKLEELRAILADLPVELVSAAEIGAPEVEEEESTLEENARKKAVEVARYARLPAIADDTGLEVDALSGAPGVLSARYAGPGATYAHNCEKLLRALAGVPAERRAARFRCVIAFSDAEGREVRLFAGHLEGKIGEAPRGGHGFGYDPLFIVAGDPLGRTLAELLPSEKNRISHRSRALAGLRAEIERHAGIAR